MSRSSVQLCEALVVTFEEIDLAAASVDLDALARRHARRKRKRARKRARS